MMLQPDGWASTATLLDETAPHQIRLQGGRRAPLNWSCTCQPVTGRAAGAARRQPIAPVGRMSVEDVIAAHAAHVLSCAEIADMFARALQPRRVGS